MRPIEAERGLQTVSSPDPRTALPSPSRRRHLFLGLYFLLALLSMGFTRPLGGEGGKLAFANVAQVLLVVWALLMHRLWVQDVLLVLFIAASMLLSGLYAHLALGVVPKAFVYLHFVTSLVFLAQFHRLLGAGDDAAAVFVRAARIALLGLLPVYGLLGAWQFMNDGAMGVSYGADDKSHAAIFMAFLAFLALAVFRRLGHAVAAAWLLLGALTISRLPYVFAPFLMLAMLVKVHRESASPRHRLLSYLAVSAVLGGGVLFVAGNLDLFESLQRLASITDRDAEPNASTVAHNWLLRLGYEIKLQRVGNLLFGVSPGSFGEALITSGLDYSELEVIDPQFIEFARLAKAPIHSTHLALFSEFPIWVFLLYLAAHALLAHRLFRRRDWNLLLYFIPFNIATLYYSAHNKAYYFLVLALLSVNVDWRRIAQRRVPT